MTPRGRLDAPGPEARLLSPTDPSREVVPVVGPVRTCVGCRKTGPRSALLRVVSGATGELVVDERRRMPGRGAWLHPDPGCLDLAERRRAFVRALRLAGPADATPVRRYVEHQEVATGPVPRAEPIVDQESGLEADGCPMSTHR